MGLLYMEHRNYNKKDYAYKRTRFHGRTQFLARTQWQVLVMDLKTPYRWISVVWKGRSRKRLNDGNYQEGKEKEIEKKTIFIYNTFKQTLPYFKTNINGLRCRLLISSIIIPTSYHCQIFSFCTQQHDMI